MSQYIEIESKFPEQKALSDIHEILLGIEALHKEDIMCGDLMPENIVIDSQGHA